MLRDLRVALDARFGQSAAAASELGTRGRQAGHSGARQLRQRRFALAQFVVEHAELGVSLDNATALGKPDLGAFEH